MEGLQHCEMKGGSRAQMVRRPPRSKREPHGTKNELLSEHRPSFPEAPAGGQAADSSRTLSGCSSRRGQWRLLWIASSHRRRARRKKLVS